MVSPTRKAMKNPIDRYQTLKLKESLSIPSQYLFACKELSFILKNAYSESPKNLQSLIFQETLFAFSLLPQIQTQSAISAANSLLQSAELVLPKQKRALAFTEHKHAVVVSKRKSKTNQKEQRQGLTLLPDDVFLHIFSFLDVRSLVSASAVCRSWNTPAGDNHLWKSLYAAFFSNSENYTEHRHRVTRRTEGKIRSLDDIGINWRHAFKTTYRETCFRKLDSYRGYCRNCCSVVWVSNNQCSNISKTKEDVNHQISTLSRQEIVEFILGNRQLSDDSSSDSDSDTDTEDAYVCKLWSYPRRLI